MLNNPNDSAERWRLTARATLQTAKGLRGSDDRRSCVSRAYFAAYQAATSVSVAHGDAVSFPQGWNNPSHEQLPDLIRNNGDLPVNTRRVLRRILRELRTLREIADYRVGRTVGDDTVKAALIMAASVFKRLEVSDDND